MNRLNNNNNNNYYNNNNNNNNNINDDNFYGAVTRTHNRFKGTVRSVHLTNAGLRQAAADLQTKPIQVEIL